MPRTGKGGRSTQPPRAANDQAYGEKGEALAAQEAIPLPDNTIQPTAPAGPTGPASMQDAVMAAQTEGALPTPLSAPTGRPDEGVMTPDNAIRNTSQAQLDAIVQAQLISGNNEFRSLAERLVMTQRANGPKPSGTRFMPRTYRPSPNEPRRVPRR